MALKMPIRERWQLRDEAATHIRESVISGGALPGTLLRLSPMAEELGMSITPVREALLLLAQAGFVIQEPNVGFRVAPLDKQDILDVYFVNRVVSGELAAKAAVAIDGDTVSILENLDGRISAAGNDGILAAKLNGEIHQIIHDCAKSARLKLFVDSASLFVPSQSWSKIEGWLAYNRTGHSTIIAALSEHDAGLARRLVENHVEEAGELLVMHMTAQGFFDK